MNPKRIALWFLIGSVALSAMVGIIALLSGTVGRIQAQIILTTLTISAASICALACGALWEKGRAKPLSLAGIALAILSACLFISGIWFESNSEAFWKFSAAVGVVALATAHACLLFLATLAPRFGWTRIAAIASVYVLAVQMIYVIYYTPNGDFFFRIVGVTSIVAASLTILTPVFHRLSRGDLSSPLPQSKPAKPGLHPTITCPRCGMSLSNSAGENKCGYCGCAFMVTILEPS